MKAQDIFMWYKYRVSIEKFGDMITEQCGRCAICNSQFIFGNEPVIDHDHSCCGNIKTCGGCIRSIICLTCNIMLGGARDDKKILLAGIEYLEKHGTPLGNSKKKERVKVSKRFSK